MPNEIKLNGVIGDGANTKEVFKAKLEMLDQDEELIVRIDSDGGDVFDGFAIHDAIKAYPGKTRALVESAAFSIASFIATACDEVEITPNGYFMLHNPMLDVQAADDEELSARAELMQQLKATMVKAYAERMGQSEAEVLAIMKRETYFNAEQAMANGLADRMTASVRPSAIASIEQVPYRVYAALRNEAGKVSETDKERKMSESKSTSVAATVSEIKSAFPKAKADFIVKCLERSLPMASVAAAAAEEMMEENEALRGQVEELTAKIAAMEEEYNAKAMEEEEQAKAQEEEEKKAQEEEEEAKAAARFRPGAKPVARVSGSTGQKFTATQRWRAEIKNYLDAGYPRAKAVSMANRQNPGLREQYLDEINHS